VTGDLRMIYFEHMWRITKYCKVFLSPFLERLMESTHRFCQNKRHSDLSSNPQPSTVKAALLVTTM
jgi:hypothetical protein